MNDRKSLAIALGVVAGIAAVGITAYFVTRCDDEAAPDINDIVDKAKETVRKLDEAVDMLRESAA